MPVFISNLAFSCIAELQLTVSWKGKDSHPAFFKGTRGLVHR